MEGYDTLLLGQFFANQAFAKRFGVFNPDPAVQRYEIAAKWQTGLSCSASIGQILGLQITGWASERYGYRPTMLTALIALTGFLFIQFFAANLPMLLVGYLLLGFPWGTFQTMTVSYAAEVMPIQIRPFLTTVSDTQAKDHKGSIAYLPPVRQSMLGHWSDHLLGCQQGLCQQHHRVGLQDPFRHPVGLAHPHRMYLYPLVISKRPADLP